MDDKQEAEAARRAEQFESIPWSSLGAEARSPGRRALVIGATILAGVLIGLFGGRIIRAATESGVVVTFPPVAAPKPVSPTDVEPDPSPAEPPPSAPATVAVVSTVVSDPSMQVPVPPQLYSEADLMAVMPEEEIRMAVVRAEWFVVDYFTVDGESATAADVEGTLPYGYDTALPHHRGEPGISYVEWARAFHVAPLGPGRYRVSVAFRTVSGIAVSDLARTAVRAVSVDVAVDDEGAIAVADLPSPRPLPETLVLESAIPDDAEPPPEVAAVALGLAGEFGDKPILAGAGIDDEGWRLTILISDQSGLEWPLVVRP